MLDYLKENIISVFSLVISLYIFFSNRKILIRSYKLSRNIVRSEELEMLFVESQQMEERIVIKLVLFNPGNIAAIINSFTVYKLVPSRIKVLKYLGFKQWREITNARWWPSCNDEAEGIKTLKTEYKSLYVKDYRNIFVSVPGYISDEDYKFFVKTNNGSIEQITDINATEIYFSHRYRKWYLN